MADTVMLIRVDTSELVEALGKLSDSMKQFADATSGVYEELSTMNVKLANANLLLRQALDSYGMPVMQPPPPPREEAKNIPGPIGADLRRKAKERKK